MNSKIHLRLMTPSDLAFADALRALAGWNQTLGDWQRLLAHEPGGCFIAEWDGSPAGTATTTRYGTDLAWIGMVLVHPDYRRRGIGQALLQHCLDYLQDVSCVKLDATPLGKMLYEQLGFQEEWSLTRWEGTPALPQLTSWPPEMQPWETSLAVEQLDTQAFGVSRQKLLGHLASQSCLASIGRDAGGNIGGYGILREGARALYAGPIVAASAELGGKLATHIAAHTRGNLVYWDIPDLNAAAVDLAKKLGLSPQRHLLRMCRGKNRHPGNPLRVFAIADPSIG
jgi:GNAT superfamily N-acetyltransferase